MKKLAITLMIVMGIFVMANTSSGGDDQLKAENNDYLTIYNHYLTMKINQCNQTAPLFNVCCNTRMSELSQMRAAQAKFYEENRAALVEAMLLNDVGTQAHQIDYFLIDQFKNRHRMAYKH